MQIKFKIITLLFLTILSKPWAQSPTPTLEIVSINLTKSLENLSDEYFLRLLTFKVGDRLTEAQLKSAIKVSRAAAQYNGDVATAELDYSISGTDVRVDFRIVNSTSNYSLSAFSSGLIFFYKHLLGETVNLGTHLGYSRQMLALDWRYIAKIPVGFYFLTGHQIANAFSEEYRSFSFGFSNWAWYWLGNYARIGIVNDFFRYFEGWEQAKNILTATVGGFLLMDYYYLLDLVDFGFKLYAQYRYYISDLNPTHDIFFDGSFLFQPFNSNRVLLKFQSKFYWTGDEVVTRNSNGISSVSGKTAWNMGFYVPIHFARISSKSEYYIGLEPGLIIGESGYDQIDFKNIQWAVSLAPVFQIGFPISAYIAPRLIYNVTEQNFSFYLDFSGLPYTKQIDLGW